MERTFKSDLEIYGHTAECIVAEWLLENEFEGYGLNKIIYNNSTSYKRLKGWDFMLLNTFNNCQVKIEQKSDADIYGNIASGKFRRIMIETSYKNQASGILTTEATIYSHFVHTTGEVFYGMTEDIIKWMQKYIDKGRTDVVKYCINENGKTTGYSISMDAMLWPDSPWYYSKIETKKVEEAPKTVVLKSKKLF